MMLKVGETVKIDVDMAERFNVSFIATVKQVDENDKDFTYLLRLSDGRDIWFMNEDVIPAKALSKVV